MAIRQYDVYFKNAFRLPSLGDHLPEGRYSVTEETLNFGHFVPQVTNHLTIPEGRLSPDHIGKIATLRIGELEKALSTDMLALPKNGTP